MPAYDHIAERAEARVGSVLKGKWKLDRVIGIGGMATVYSATHRNQSRAAIKLLHPEVSLDMDVTSRFLREGYVANVVDHEGTVKVIDDDVSDDGAPFLVMELLEGETVDARWARKDKRLPVGEVLAIADQMLDVLAAAHDRQIVHRDLKPENLFLTRNGELKILDFGIARLREVTPGGTTETRAGMVLGTPPFMAPEQARGRWDEVDARTDIYAVGATLFTLLSGRFVHDAQTVQEQLIRAATVQPSSIATFEPGLPQPVIELVDRALMFDKAQRWNDARTMKTALKAAIGLEDSAPLTLPAPSGPDMSDATTIVAPPELASAITGRSLTTARPVTQGVDSDTLRKHRKHPMKPARVAALVVGALLLVGVGSVGAYAWTHRVTPTEGGVIAMPGPPMTPTGEAKPASETPLVVGPSKVEEGAVPDKPETPTASKPTVDKRTSTSKPTTKKTPTEAKSESTAIETSKGIKPAGSGNPFDRRL